MAQSNEMLLDHKYILHTTRRNHISQLASRLTLLYIPGKTDQRCIAAIDGWNAKSDEKL